MVAMHHVNLGVPPGGIEAQTSFLVDVLGYRQMVPTPEAAAFGATWFEAGDGSQVHLSEDPEHRPAGRAHVAVTMGDDLERAARAAGTEVHDTAVGRMAVCQDPSGNRWELRP